MLWIQNLENSLTVFSIIMSSPIQASSAISPPNINVLMSLIAPSTARSGKSEVFDPSCPKDNEITLSRRQVFYDCARKSQVPSHLSLPLSHVKKHLWSIWLFVVLLKNRWWRRPESKCFLSQCAVISSQTKALLWENWEQQRFLFFCSQG
jgi:hypothetical protein